MSNSIRKMCDLLARAGFPVYNVDGQTRIRGNPVTPDEPIPSWVKPGTPDPPGMITTNRQPVKAVDNLVTNVTRLKRKPGRPKKIKRSGARPQLRESMSNLLQKLRGKNGGI